YVGAVGGEVGDGRPGGGAGRVAVEQRDLRSGHRNEYAATLRDGLALRVTHARLHLVVEIARFRLAVGEDRRRDGEEDSSDDEHDHCFDERESASDRYRSHGPYRFRICSTSACTVR